MKLIAFVTLLALSLSGVSHAQEVVSADDDGDGAGVRQVVECTTGQCLHSVKQVNWNEFGPDETNKKYNQMDPGMVHPPAKSSVIKDEEQSI